jgi:hypothetical protein
MAPAAHPPAVTSLKSAQAATGANRRQMIFWRRSQTARHPDWVPRQLTRALSCGAQSEIGGGCGGSAAQARFVRRQQEGGQLHPALFIVVVR